MHPQAFDWVSRHVTPDPGAVLEIGARDINGSVRQLFAAADYTALDVAAGAGVDVVADAATWTPDREYDVVVCCEVFEHTASWPDICATALKACRLGGLFVATMAGPGRPLHSGVDGHWALYPGEHYANVEPGELRRVLEGVGWGDVVVDQLGTDVRATARRD